MAYVNKITQVLKRTKERREARKRAERKKKFEKKIRRKYGAGTPEYYDAYNKYLYGDKAWEAIKSGGSGYTDKEGYHIPEKGYSSSSSGSGKAGSSPSQITQATTTKQTELPTKQGYYPEQGILITEGGQGYSMALQYAPEIWQPERPSPEERKKELARREAEKIYATATPWEQAGLHAHTLLSPAGYKYMGSYVAPHFFPEAKTPEQTVKGQMATMRVMKPNETQQYIFESAFFNPVVETETLFLGGLGAGAVVARAPRIGAVLSSKGGRAVMYGFGTTYAAGQSYNILGEYHQKEYSKMFGTGIETAVGITAMGKGWKAGQKIGGESLVKSQVPELGAGAKIAKKVEGVKSEWFREPEQVRIEYLPEGLKGSSFEVIKGKGATTFGGVSKETQFMPKVRAGTADVDIATGNTKALQKELLKVTRSMRTRSKGTGIVTESGHLFDIKPISRLKAFPYAKSPIKTPKGKKVTRLGEEMWRSLYGSIQRGERPGWQGQKDIVRFFKSGETLLKSKEIQIKRSKLPFKEYRLKRLGKVREEFETLKGKKPEIIRKLETTTIRQPKFTQESYLPKWGKASYIPKVPKSYLPPKPSKPSLLPSRPSRPSPLPTEPSPIIPSSRIGLRPPLPKPPPSEPSGHPPSRMPPSPLPPPPPTIIEPPPRKPPKRGKPLFRFGSYDISKEFKKASRSWETSRKYEYMPSLTAIVTGLKATKAPKTMTGVSIRPVVSKRRR